MKNLFLEDELKYFFLRFYWDVCLFTLVKPIIMGGGGCGFHFAMTLSNQQFSIVLISKLVDTIILEEERRKCLCELGIQM